MDIKCRKIQGMIEAFLDDRLHGAERQEFVTHVRGCKACRDELEVYHVIYSVVEQLDNDRIDEDSDYIGSLERKLGRSDIIKRKWLKQNMMIAIGSLTGVGLIVAGIIISHL